MEHETLGYEWPPDVDVLIIPEARKGTVLLGGGDHPVAGDVYPSELIDLTKILREKGVRSAYATPREDRLFLSRKAAIEWLGVLVLLRDFVLSGGASYVAAAIRERIGDRRLRTTKVQGRVGVARIKDGETRVAWMEVRGITGEELCQTFIESVQALTDSHDVP